MPRMKTCMIPMGRPQCRQMKVAAVGADIGLGHVPDLPCTASRWPKCTPVVVGSLFALAHLLIGFRIKAASATTLKFSVYSLALPVGSTVKPVACLGWGCAVIAQFCREGARVRARYEALGHDGLRVDYASSLGSCLWWPTPILAACRSAGEPVQAGLLQPPAWTSA